MGKPPTTEERVGILEVLNKDGMKRIARLEYFVFGALATGVATLLSVWLKK